MKNYESSISWTGPFGGGLVLRRQDTPLLYLSHLTRLARPRVGCRLHHSSYLDEFGRGGIALEISD